MEERDVSAWSTMIKGYGVNHEGEMAVKCFEDMLEQGVRPDTVTFTCLLAACNHSGLVDEGWAILKRMREEHGIEPVEEHDVCMVSLLAKSGHLFEAEMFLERIRSSSQKTWASLLSACKTFGEEHLASRCFQRLVQIDPNVAAWYVLLAGAYAGADMWDEANRLEELRRYAGLPKKPASASIEIGGEVHEFVVGKNRNHDVSEMLSAVNSGTKGKGHVPNVGFVLRPFPDQRKESLLCEHAEKLALAFGLIHTPQGATLRVTKSLRMCGDCHDVSKLVSKAEKREIIIRDDCSLHRFIDGSCSCGDMF
jgi:pentatricopeptide repeat protein